MIATVERKDFQDLFDALQKKGYQISGPTLKDNAVIYDNISSVDDLPTGWTDKQDAGLKVSNLPSGLSFFVEAFRPQN